MKSSEILRQAAWRVEQMDGGWLLGAGCYHIAKAAKFGCDGAFIPPRHEGAMSRFDLMKPEPHERVITSNELWWDPDPKHIDRCARVIGLCLAAAIAESEGD